MEEIALGNNPNKVTEKEMISRILLLEKQVEHLEYENGLLKRSLDSVAHGTNSQQVDTAGNTVELYKS